jgi:acetyltransferase-like isoleucine patch superfamily enzyme
MRSVRDIFLVGARRGTQICTVLVYYAFNYWLTYLPVHCLRVFYLRRLMRIRVGRGSFIHMGCVFYERVSIGRNSVIGRSCHLLGNITIKDNVSITAQSYIFSSSHYKDSPTFEAYTRPVIIEDYAWLGARAMVLPGVTIGRGSVLGANSTATKDIPEFSVYVGSPAKQIGVRSRHLTYTLAYSPFLQ